VTEDDRKHYDRKVSHAEELLPYLGLLVGCGISAWVFYCIWAAIQHLIS
jgi:hypothetical protein